MTESGCGHEARPMPVVAITVALSEVVLTRARLLKLFCGVSHDGSVFSSSERPSQACIVRTHITSRRFVRINSAQCTARGTRLVASVESCASCPGPFIRLLFSDGQAIVPDDLLAELGVAGKLAGQKKNRVKATRFRGELSQGLVCSPRVLVGVDLRAANESNVDFSQRLGIVKWVPEAPTSLSGEIIPAPQMMSWIEIEDIKRYPNIFAAGEPVNTTMTR
jgi:hypothetical protein